MGGGGSTVKDKEPGSVSLEAEGAKGARGGPSKHPCFHG